MQPLRWVLPGLVVLLFGCSHQAPRGSLQGPHSPVAEQASPQANADCTITVEGRIHGAVDSPDGAPGQSVYVTLIFSGGPTESQLVRAGQYSLPLLARRCPDGLHWVRFALRAVGVSKGITPTSPDVREDLTVGAVPTDVPATIPDCELVLGTLQGRILVHRAPAPDNTVVTSSGPPGTGSLDQEIRTRNWGYYSLPNLGLRCGSDAPRSLTRSISALGVTVTLPVQPLDINQDIVVP